jgi:type IV pilus assembly protein PilY1
MKFLNPRILCVLVGMASVLSAPSAYADDSEVFTSAAFKTGEGVRPNVLFVIDTSGSMDSEVITYDENVKYEGTCDENYIYWKPWAEEDNSTPPACTTTRKIKTGANRCQAAYKGLKSDGWWNGRVAQLNATSNATGWIDLQDKQPDRKVECEADASVHGDVNADSNDSGNKKWARDSGTPGDSARWTSNKDATGVIDWDGNKKAGIAAKNRVNFYSANYINWFNLPEDKKGGGSIIKTRMEIVKEVANKVIDKLTDVNLGLMRYSNNAANDNDELEAQGGMVTYAISPLTTTSRTAMKTLINSYTPDGWTPLSETLYEAQQYLGGGSVVFGDTSAPSKSVKESRTGGLSTSKTYESPMDYSCQSTFVVYLTDGLPTQDTQADKAIQELPNFGAEGFVPTSAGGGGSDAKGNAVCPAKGPETTSGRCMVNLAGYMHNHDYNTTVGGKQTITTYIVGFGSEITASKAYLDNIAKAGGGRAYTQTDAVGLAAALEEIFTDVIQDANSTFVSPTVAVNAFNRTRNLNSLYVSVFAPTARMHWPGNVKKYKLKDGKIYGAGTNPPEAVNPDTGFFADGTADLFNKTPKDADGPEVPKGGMVSQLPSWKDRKIYTYLDGIASPTKDLTDAKNAFATTNDNITYETLGLGTSTKRNDVLEFMRGKDYNDENGNKVFDDERAIMGDPMHSRPAVAIYGGTELAPEGLVYVSTNDGFLHAIDMNTGVEQWAFIPSEMISRSAQLQRDPAQDYRSYGLDGDVRVFKYDADGDGVVETGDKVYVLFGFGRGGSAYYALDVTSQTKPAFLWKKTKTELPALGQAWSTPVVTRVNVGGTLQTDKQKLVAIFGGGYNPAQDNYAYVEDEGLGNAIYMIELSSGNLLWSAGSATSTASLKLTDMKSAIPADITVLDINGDSYADRMYAGDMGGRIWRFDIWHGEEPATLVSGGVLATLGAGHLDNPTSAANKPSARRFYYSPDIALVSSRGSAPYVNIAIGSGYRGHPLDKDVDDRFYSVRDYQPFNRRTPKSWEDVKPITDAQLVDVTSKIDSPVTDGANGWKIELQGDGEKILAESITANGVIQFPSFTPTGVNKDNPCLATTLNRAWQVYLENGMPYVVKDANKPTAQDRYTDLKQGGIAPGTAIIMTQDEDGKKGREPICLNGVEAKSCPKIGDVTRTFWERQ